MPEYPGPGLNDLQKTKLTPFSPKSAEVVMTLADTEYEWEIPDGTREFSLVLKDDTVAWRFSSTTGQVAVAGGGTPRGAGKSVDFVNGFYTGTVYFASSDAAETMRIEYV